ncbi:MAG: V-type ATP synthase subunit F [archaeon]
MVEICVVGKSDFVLGFTLAGIKKIIEIEDEITPSAVEKIFLGIIEDPDCGLIITDNNTAKLLTKETRNKLEELNRPIFMVISQKESDNSLGEKIKSSLGIDIQMS